MLAITVLVLLTIFFQTALNKMFLEGRRKREGELNNFNSELDKLTGENLKLKAGNRILEKIAYDTIALYDITREICKSLDENRIFTIFRSHLNKLVSIKNCRFIKDKADINDREGYLVYPLQIHNDTVYHLLISGSSDQDKEKLQILSQQFLLGVRRAFLYQRVQELSITDGLSQAFGYRYFIERFKEELVRSKKFKYSLSFLMVDIDHFKSFNDNYGHLVGDSIIRGVSKIIRETIRQIDFLGRYGGDELAVVLSETDKKQGVYAAERIRRAVELNEFSVYDEKLKVTVSIGISTFPQDSSELSMLIEYADKALYRSKEEGRNRASAYDPKKEH